jgi:hypothetical protein
MLEAAKIVIVSDTAETGHSMQKRANKNLLINIDLRLT